MVLAAAVEVDDLDLPATWEAHMMSSALIVVLLHWSLSRVIDARATSL
jgi:hypothetical protein